MSSIHSSLSSSHLSFGVLANLAGHVVSTLDKCPCDVIVVDRDNAQRNEEVDEENHN